MKDTVLAAALLIALAGITYGAFNHTRFIKAGGQASFRVQPVDLMPERVRGLYRAMLWGYGMFVAGIVAALAVSSAWGSIGT